MKTGREERLRPGHRLCGLLLGVLLSVVACAPPLAPPAEQEKPTGPDMGRPGTPPPLAEQEAPAGPEVGRPGGRLVVALAAEPKTLNPAVVGDLSSRAIVHRIMADLIRIDRESQETVPELAESWTVSPDGRRHTLKLRSGLRFSDGHPVDAEDIVFSFRVYLDEDIASPGRDLLLIGGKPLVARKLDSHTVEFVLSEPYAAAERLFDGFAILPRHLLERTYQAGRLADAWGLDTPPEEIVGLGPFRLKEHRPGERLVLERNPFYWKHDAAGQPLPYLDEITVLFTSTQEAQTLRFLAGDLDVIDRLGPEDFAVLDRAAQRQEFRLYDLGAGLDFHFMFFNLNELKGKNLPELARKQRWFRQLEFRRAVQSAIDLKGIVRLVFQGRATALASHVTPGSKHWINRDLEPPRRSLERARQLLEDSGFRWEHEGRLVDQEGQRVEFSLLTIASRPQTTRAATVIQDDLRQIGMDVQVVPLELKAVLERLLTTHDYEACVMGLGGGSGGPNPMMNVLPSSGSHHLWHLGQDQPATPWEAEIDHLMRQQLSTLDPEERKRLYDRVQQLVADKLPIISLVSPNVLVGAKEGLGNFRPAILPHQTLWNAEELFWLPKDS